MSTSDNTTRLYWAAAQAVRQSSNGKSPRLARQDIEEMAGSAHSAGQIGSRAVATIAEAVRASNVGARRTALWELARLQRGSSPHAAVAGEALAEESRHLPQTFVAETLSGEYMRRGHERRHQRLVDVVRRAAAANNARVVREGVAKLFDLAQYALSPIDHRIIDDLVAMLDWSSALARKAAGDVLQWGIDVAFDPSLAQYTEDALQRRHRTGKRQAAPDRAARRKRAAVPATYKPRMTKPRKSRPLIEVMVCKDYPGVAIVECLVPTSRLDALVAALNEQLA